MFFETAANNDNKMNTHGHPIVILNVREIYKDEHKLIDHLLERH